MATDSVVPPGVWVDDSDDDDPVAPGGQGACGGGGLARTAAPC